MIIKALVRAAVTTNIKSGKKAFTSARSVDMLYPRRGGATRASAPFVEIRWGDTMPSEFHTEMGKELVLRLPKRDYSRLVWLKAWRSRQKRRQYSIEETVGYLLDREERVEKIKLWSHTVVIFLLITAVLLLPFGVSLKAFLVLALVGGIFGIISFYLIIPKAFKDAKPINDEKLLNLLEKLSQEAGLKNPPQLMTLDTPEINALAVSGRKSCVILTQGLLEAYYNGTLTEEELVAIIGHELGHLKNHDGLRRSLAFSWISIFSAGGELVTFFGIKILNQARHEEEILASIMLLVAGIFVMFFGLYAKLLAKIASLLYFYLSRKQENDADNVGAQLTHPSVMGSALGKIEKLNDALVQAALQQLPFPDQWQVKPRKLSFIDRLWTTHPPTETRVQRLQELAQFVE